MPAKKKKYLRTRDMRRFCSKCEQKKENKCKSLCQIAEVYVSQDNVDQKELLLKNPRIWTDIGATVGVDPKTPEQLKIFIIQLHLDNMSDHEIAYHLPCSISYIARIIRTYKSSMAKSEP